MGKCIYHNTGLSSCEDGRHWSTDAYSYGKKWQCVEFVRRFYKDHLHHKMPSKYGNAIDYFNPTLKQGELNKDRGLIQFSNGTSEKPAKDDLLVFTFPPGYGHVAIVSEVADDYIIIAQQNSLPPFENIDLEKKDGKWHIQSSCLDFLRLPK